MNEGYGMVRKLGWFVLFNFLLCLFSGCSSSNKAEIPKKFEPLPKEGPVSVEPGGKGAAPK
jgi:hypothetical protein